MVTIYMKYAILAILLLIMIYCLLRGPATRNEYLDNPPPIPLNVGGGGTSGGGGGNNNEIVMHNVTILQNKLEQTINQLTALKAQVASNTSNIDLVQQSVNTINTLISNLQTHMASGK